MAAQARDHGEMARRVWGGAVPLTVHLHDADVTALPPPPPLQTFGHRFGYLPLLVPTIKSHFSSTLPPGIDTVWFEYKGLPLKWYIPTGVLFDLLCADAEKLWNLTVHFRRYPAEILSPCEGEDSVKWNYNNSLKEAAFIIAGNSKNVMNMSQADQVAMWESVKNGILTRNKTSMDDGCSYFGASNSLDIDLDGYMNAFTRLKLGPFEEDCLVRTSSAQRRHGSHDPESLGGKPCLFTNTWLGRVPVRLYVRRVQEDLEYLEDAIPVSDWETVSYINRPFEIQKEEGRSHITMAHALETLLPEFFGSKADSEPLETPDSALDNSYTTPRAPRDRDPASACQREADAATKVKLVRVQGLEVGMDMSFLLVAKNLKNPECYLHICVYIGA